MSGFFDRMLGRGNKESSAHTAKERLQFILVHDRINLSPERLQEMKAEILEVISKYVAISPEEVEIALEQGDRSNSMIVAEIPFTSSVISPTNDETDSQTDEEESPIDDDDAPLIDDDDEQEQSEDEDEE